MSTFFTSREWWWRKWDCNEFGDFLLERLWLSRAHRLSWDDLQCKIPVLRFVWLVWPRVSLRECDCTQIWNCLARLLLLLLSWETTQKIRAAESWTNSMQFMCRHFLSFNTALYTMINLKLCWQQLSTSPIWRHTQIRQTGFRCPINVHSFRFKHSVWIFTKMSRYVHFTQFFSNLWCILPLFWYILPWFWYIFFSVCNTNLTNQPLCILISSW